MVSLAVVPEFDLKRIMANIGWTISGLFGIVSQVPVNWLEQVRAAQIKERAALPHR